MHIQDIIKKITDKILTHLNNGSLPWRKSWKSGIPINFITHRPYNGINFLSLLTNDYPSPYYLTFLQCQQRGGRINTGEKGHLIVYWSIKEILDEEENLRQVPIIRYSYVFNLSQTTLYEDKTTSLKINTCEEIIRKASPVIKHNISQCYYNPKEDIISLPTIENFESKEEYYASLFHELIHWTGHQSRLNRKKTDYAYEELIAEIGAAYLCGITQISNQTLANQSAYIEGWIKRIKNEPKVLLKAAAEAHKAVNYILNKQEEET